MEYKLKPKSVTVESSVKYFGLERGESTGSTISITFDIPEGVEVDLLKRALFAEKKKLDTYVITQEYIRGAITTQLYKESLERLRNGYGQLLGTPASGIETQEQNEPK